MKKNLLITLLTALTLTACGETKGEAGDACASDDDCVSGLHCHIEDGHDADADADADADEDSGDHDDHDDHGDETGVCEEEDGHEGHDH